MIILGIYEWCNASAWLAIIYLLQKQAWKKRNKACTAKIKTISSKKAVVRHILSKKKTAKEQKSRKSKLQVKRFTAKSVEAINGLSKLIQRTIPEKAFPSVSQSWKGHVVHQKLDKN